MSEPAKKKISDKLFGLILAGIIGMAFASLAIHLANRFTGHATGWSFYSDTADMTCVVVTSRGQQLMDCLPGDRVLKESIHD